jgi:hypothetical protein
MSAEEWAIELPEEWQTAPYRQGFVRVMAEAKLSNGHAALLVTGMLKDGTVIYALSWHRGQRVARLSPDTGWALEERFTGREPSAADKRKLTKLWRIAMDSMAAARKETEADRAAGYPDMPLTALALSSNDILDEAYETYCEQADGDPVSRDDFETAVEYLAANDLLEGRRDR